VTEIAQAMGMARPNVSRILGGQGDPTLSTLERLAAALDCAVADLITTKPRHRSPRS
jgi:DNA-binding Xre family transcriptional regulator